MYIIVLWGNHRWYYTIVKFRVLIVLEFNKLFRSKNSSKDKHSALVIIVNKPLFIDAIFLFKDKKICWSRITSRSMVESIFSKFNKPWPDIFSLSPYIYVISSSYVHTFFTSIVNDNENSILTTEFRSTVEPRRSSCYSSCIQTLQQSWCTNRPLSPPLHVISWPLCDVFIPLLTDNALKN